MTATKNRSKQICLFSAGNFRMLAASVESSEGTWTAWGEYSKCTKSCGGGTQSRIRTCVNPSQPFGHKTCRGAFRQRRLCNAQHCPGKSKGQHA